jgi:N-acetylmuramoyl-L-alanine amidase CwlA
MQLDAAFAELNIVQDFIPAGNSNRPGTKITPVKITIHNTDNDSPGANAAAHAKYQKGADARKRKVSWHFTVDDKGVFQSLPTNEIGWHAASKEGNRTSIGIEICMHPEMDVKAGYRRAALLTAVMAQQLGISVVNGIVQHHFWSGKNCPRVLRAKPNGWSDFLDQIRSFKKDLEPVEAPRIAFMHLHDDA